MSLVQDLADQLRVTREELPLAQVASATERLRTATGLLAWVLHESNTPTTVPDLTHAVSRLEHAGAAIRVAQDAIEEYSFALGMPADAFGQDSSWQAAMMLPSQPVKAGGRVAVSDAKLADWWADRVSQLTASSTVVDRSDAAPHSAELLRRCVDAALDGNTAKLHRHLTAAGPAIGLGLATVAPPLLRQLATELIGHPPRLEDLARVRRAAIPLGVEVLPDLAPDAAEEIIARVCHARTQRAAGRGPTHPVDAAVSAALLVAGLLRAGGRGVDELARVIEDERVTAQAQRLRATERADSHRTALRITDSGRRRSAVDELAPSHRPTKHRSGG